jgi:hypothetical protein
MEGSRAKCIREMQNEFVMDVGEMEWVRVV